MSRRYRPCPEKLALANDYDKQRCTESLEQCWKQGAGLNMSYEQYLSLEQAVLDICCEQHLKLQFKREIREVDILIDEEVDSDIPYC